MNTFFLAKSWGDFLGAIIKAPQNYVFWVIIFLVVLFLLSRLRNIMEERGVNRAIYVSRAFVGTVISFIITPIVFYIMLNLVALVHGVNTIDISFLAKWLGLTVTSYWWLLKCFFGSASISGAEELYSLDSMIRIIWILLPFSFIWLRVSSTRIGKLFLIPLIIGTLVITRYKYAPPTFITQDENLIERIPGLDWVKTNKDNFSTSGGVYLLSPIQRRIAAGILCLFILAGFIVGLRAKRRVPGLLLALIGLMGFILLAPHDNDKIIPQEHKKDYNINIDSLVLRMDSVYTADPESLEAYYLSQKISAAYRARLAVGDMIRFPKDLCERYNSYFYDWCKD